jgi:hypothetical protein
MKLQPRSVPNPDSLSALSEYFRVNHPHLISVLCLQTGAEFDTGLESILEEAIDYLERNANHLASLSEEAISAFLVAYLNKPGLRVTQEAHSNGHVDITIEAEHTPPLRRRLGEAKIYDGPSYHVNGLEQLINRYSTGREGSGIMGEYVKKANIMDLVAKVRLHMDTNKPCAQSGDSQEHRIRWAFMTNHRHSSGELLRVLHLNCNLYCN